MKYIDVKPYMDEIIDLMMSFGQPENIPNHIAQIQKMKDIFLEYSYGDREYIDPDTSIGVSIGWRHLDHAQSHLDHDFSTPLDYYDEIAYINSHLLCALSGLKSARIELDGK